MVVDLLYLIVIKNICFCVQSRSITALKVYIIMCTCSNTTKDYYGNTAVYRCEVQKRDIKLSVYGVCSLNAGWILEYPVV